MVKTKPNKQKQRNRQKIQKTNDQTKEFKNEDNQ